MKKILLLLLAAALPLAAGAQKMTFTQLQEKYADEQGYTTVEITQAMLELMSKSNKKAPESSLIGSIGGITRISILTASRAEDDFVADMKKVVGEGSGYKLLASVNENGQHTLFHYKEVPNPENGDEPPRISELVMILHGASDNLIMSIHGDFTIKQITSIIDQASSDGKIDIGF